MSASMGKPIDKSTWGDGPWMTEPDRVEFEHAGLPCLLNRSGTGGNWCGYAAVPPGHPMHGKNYNDVDVEVHGGLAYAGECSGAICHVPKPGEPDNVFWFGFDCAHCWDVSPGTEAFLRTRGIGGSTGRDDGSSYRTVDYVRHETERLAEQLAAMAHG